MVDAFRIVRYAGHIVRHSEQYRTDAGREIRRQALSVGVAVAPVGVAFGLAASDAGLTAWQASAYSLLVFAGSAQFAAVDIVGDGGTVLAAVMAGVLLNLRSLAFGVSMAPSLGGAWWKRATLSHLMIDEAAAIGSAQADRELRRYGYLCAGLAIFVAWNISTVIGASALPASDDLVTDWGIDAAFPAIFLALLWPRLAEAAQRRTAVLGGLIALALVPFAPPGVPIIVAGTAVAAGWRNGRETSAQGRQEHT